MNADAPSKRARCDFVATLFDPDRFAFGELLVVRNSGGYEMFGPGATPASPENTAHPEAFRQWIRQSEEGRYRPLSGAVGLRRGWRRRCAEVGALVEELEMIYPLALDHLRLQRAGSLTVTRPEAVLDRHGVPPRKNAAAIQAVVTGALCRDCVRVPLWAGPAAELGVRIPCPEPCSVWVSLCRRAFSWAAHPHPAVPADPSVGFADFGVAGNPLRVSVCQHIAGKGE